VRNLENYLVGYSVSYLTGYPAGNSANYWERCPGRSWAESSSDCRENCPPGNPESNLLSNGADNPLSYSESNPADSSASYLRNFGGRVCPAMAERQSLQSDDLGDP
jgi:hypothetical protein